MSAAASSSLFLIPPERLLEVAEVLRETRVKVLRVLGKG
jgi:hypothetical protein